MGSRHPWFAPGENPTVKNHLWRRTHSRSYLHSLPGPQDLSDLGYLDERREETDRDVVDLNKRCSKDYPSPLPPGTSLFLPLIEGVIASERSNSPEWSETIVGKGLSWVSKSQSVESTSRSLLDLSTGAVIRVQGVDLLSVLLETGWINVHRRLLIKSRVCVCNNISSVRLCSPFPSSITIGNTSSFRRERGPSPLSMLYLSDRMLYLSDRKSVEKKQRPPRRPRYFFNVCSCSMPDRRYDYNRRTKTSCTNWPIDSWSPLLSAGVVKTLG